MNLDARPISLPEGYREFGPFSVPDGYSAVQLTLARKTTATPTYWDDGVTVNLDSCCSVDGGVTWLNLPVNNTYYVTASKDGVNYPTVKFNIDLADRVEDGVELYIASRRCSVPRYESGSPLSDRWVIRS